MLKHHQSRSSVIEKKYTTSPYLTGVGVNIYDKGIHENQEFSERFMKLMSEGFNNTIERLGL